MSSGESGILEEEEPEALGVLAQLQRLRRRDALVDVVQQLDLVAELLPGRLQQRERAPRVGRGLEHRGRVERLHRGLPAPRAVAGHPRHAHLHADVAEAGRHVGAGVVDHLGDLGAARVRVAVRRLARLAAEKLVHGHPGLAALDVPQRHVDAADGVVEHGAVAPVGARVERLPGVLDPVRGLADQERLQVALHRRHHEVGALREGGAAVAVEPVLVGRDLDHHQPQPGRRRGDRAHVRDLRRRQAPQRPLRLRVRGRRTRSQQPRRGPARGQTERLAPPHASLPRPGAGSARDPTLPRVA